MLAGCCLASSSISPSTRMYSVEPEGYDDHARSFKQKIRKSNTGEQTQTICDALQASQPGELTWKVNGDYLSGASWMSDEAAVEAMKVAFEELKIVVEPSGALGLAALLGGEIPVKKGDVVVVVACGGNVSLENFVEWMR